MYNDGFCPYEIYMYNVDKNTYELIASVEEWDLATCPNALSFPYKDDKDNDKKIYLVNSYGDSHYYDEKEYNDWKEKLLGSKLIELNWYVVNSVQKASILYYTSKPFGLMGRNMLLYLRYIYSKLLNNLFLWVYQDNNNH